MENKTKLAIFDFDGTLFPLQTIPFLMKQYKRRMGKILPYYLTYGSILIKYAAYKLKSTSKEKFRDQAAVGFVRMFNGESMNCLEAFFDKAAEDVYRELNPDIVAEVKKAVAEGHCTLLLSGCYAPLIERIASRLGMHGAIGTALPPADSRGKIRIKALTINAGRRKVDSLLEYVQDMPVHWEESTAYADSGYDRYLLELVGSPIAVNPDEALKQTAEEAGWRILNTPKGERDSA